MHYKLTYIIVVEINHGEKSNPFLKDDFRDMNKTEAEPSGYCFDDSLFIEL